MFALHILSKPNRQVISFIVISTEEILLLNILSQKFVENQNVSIESRSRRGVTIAIVVNIQSINCISSFTQTCTYQSLYLGTIRVTKLILSRKNTYTKYPVSLNKQAFQVKNRSGPFVWPSKQQLPDPRGEGRRQRGEEGAEAAGTPHTHRHDLFPVEIVSTGKYLIRSEILYMFR